MPSKLKNLTVTMISLVDRGANQEATIELLKRAPQTPAAAPSSGGVPPDDVLRPCPVPGCGEMLGDQRVGGAWMHRVPGGYHIFRLNAHGTLEPFAGPTAKREPFRDWLAKARDEDTRLARLLGQEPASPTEDSVMNVRETIAKAERGHASAEELEAAREAVADSLFAAELHRRVTANPALPIAKAAAEARVACRAAAAELHPELARPSAPAATIAKRSSLEAERARELAVFEAVQQSFEARGIRRGDALAKAMRDPVGGAAYEKYCRIGYKLQRGEADNA